MTQEQINELMKPRYIVENLWFNCEFNPGDILVKIPHSNAFSVEGFESGMYAIPEDDIDKCPYLVRKLHWWQERSPEELPRYVRNAADGIIFIVEYNFNSPAPSDARTWNKRFKIPFWHSLHDLLPATEADYNEYLQTLTNNQEP